MWYNGYYIFYHQDICGGMYAVYSKHNQRVPNYFNRRESAIGFIDRLQKVGDNA